MSPAGRRRAPKGAAVGLSDRVAELSRAVELADGRLDETAVAGARRVIDKVEGRQRHGTDHTLVALLGATGGGKSSLANAVTGTTVATTGVRRPTTATTLAFTWGPPHSDGSDAGPLLDWLEVPNRHQLAAEGGAATPLDGLVLLDVPDHDSVALANRQEMERIAELADLMVWVTDAEKYADKAMHGYLRRLREHGGVVALVLNKADQLAPADAERLRSDLGQLLADDGLAGAPVLVASATDGRGIAEVRSLLARAVAERRAMVERLEADVRTAASDLLAELGSGADGRGADEIPRRVARTLAADLVEGSGLSAVLDAVAAGHRRDAAARTGWPFTRWARSLRPHPLRRLHLGRGSGGRASLPAPSGLQRARTEGAVRQAVRAVTDPLPHPWPDLIRRAATPDPALLADRVDQAVAQAVRAETADEPGWWRLANGIQLALAAAALVGALWLTLLAAGAWLQLPDVPTPTWRRIPLPTGLLVGGLLLGGLLAVATGRLARVGAARRRRAVRKRAEDAVADVARDLVVAPLQAELGRLHELRRALLAAGGTLPGANVVEKGRSGRHKSTRFGPEDGAA